MFASSASSCCELYSYSYPNPNVILDDMDNVFKNLCDESINSKDSCDESVRDMSNTLDSIDADLFYFLNNPLQLTMYITWIIDEWKFIATSLLEMKMCNDIIANKMNEHLNEFMLKITHGKEPISRDNLNEFIVIVRSMIKTFSV